MLKVRHLPKEPFTLACSGGSDSMAALHFFLRSSKNVSVLHINHGTPNADTAEKLVHDFCKKHNVPFESFLITAPKNKEVSREEFWRNERYKVFHQKNHPVVTVHHLGDEVETWIFSSLHGSGKIIPYRNKNVVRPFLLTQKEDFVNYCTQNNVPFSEDPSNTDTSFMRNKIRHQIVPLALEVNPGLFKVVRKKVLAHLEEVTSQNTIFKEKQNTSCKKNTPSVKMSP